MRPTQTLYRLSEPRDIPVCKKLWAEDQIDPAKRKKLGWPTVVAERHSKILGFISTWPDNKFVSPGPLVVNEWSIITAMRLIEAWENVVRQAGVTSYYFYIDKKNEKWIKLVRKLGCEESKKIKSGSWFKRAVA